MDKLSPIEFIIFSLGEHFKDSKYKYVKDRILKLAKNDKGTTQWENVETKFQEWINIADEDVKQEETAARERASESGGNDSDGPPPTRRGGGRMRKRSSRKTRSSRTRKRKGF